MTKRAAIVLAGIGIALYYASMALESTPMLVASIIYNIPVVVRLIKG